MLVGGRRGQCQAPACAQRGQDGLGRPKRWDGGAQRSLSGRVCDSSGSHARRALAGAGGPRVTDLGAWAGRQGHRDEGSKKEVLTRSRAGAVGGTGPPHLGGACSPGAGPDWGDRALGSGDQWKPARRRGHRSGLRQRLSGVRALGSGGLQCRQPSSTDGADESSARGHRGPCGAAGLQSSWKHTGDGHWAQRCPGPGS